MATQYDELKLTVTLVDNASAGLAALQDKLAKLGKQPLAQISKDSKDLSEGFNKLGEAFGFSFNKLSPLVKGFASAGGAIGAVGFMVNEAKKNLADFSEKIMALNVSAQAVGVGGAQMKAMIEVFEESGVSAEAATRNVQGLAAAMSNLTKMGSTLRQHLMSEAGLDPRASEAMERSLVGMSKKDMASFGNEVVKNAKTIATNMYDRQIAMGRSTDEAATRAAEAAQKYVNAFGAPDLRRLIGSFYTATPEEVRRNEQNLAIARQYTIEQAKIAHARERIANWFARITSGPMLEMEKKMAKVLNDIADAAEKSEKIREELEKKYQPTTMDRLNPFSQYNRELEEKLYPEMYKGGEKKDKLLDPLIRRLQGQKPDVGGGAAWLLDPNMGDGDEPRQRATSNRDTAFSRWLRSDAADEMAKLGWKHIEDRRTQRGIDEESVKAIDLNTRETKRLNDFLLQQQMDKTSKDATKDAASSPLAKALGIDSIGGGGGADGSGGGGGGVRMQGLAGLPGLQRYRGGGEQPQTPAQQPSAPQTPAQQTPAQQTPATQPAAAPATQTTPTAATPPPNTGGTITDADQKARPLYMHGQVSLGGQSFNWGSGALNRGRGSIPYGDYPINIGRGDIGPTGQRIGSVATVGGAGGEIPDPKYPGRPREGIQIHPNSSNDLDRLYTAGCFSIPKAQWPAFKAKLLAEAQKNGQLMLHVGKDGRAAIYPASQQKQMAEQTAAQQAQAPTAGSKKTMLFLHGMETRYGNKSPAEVEASARKYAAAKGYNLEVLDVSGDNQAKQTALARQRIAKGGVDAVFGFSAGGNSAATLKKEFPNIDYTILAATNKAGDVQIPGVKHMDQVEALAKKAEQEAAARQPAPAAAAAASALPQAHGIDELRAISDKLNRADMDKTASKQTEASMNLKVDVKGQPGVKVEATGDGAMKGNVEVNRTMPPPQATPTNAGDSAAGPG